MAKKISIAPSWWQQHKARVWREQLQHLETEKKKYDEKSALLIESKGQRRSTYDEYQKQQKEKELARLFQYIQSASALMRKDNNRIELMLTFTISQPHRVADTDKSFDSVMQRIQTQADSLLYHIRTLSKSTVFKSEECKECAYKRRLHYHWALELQTSGDVHMHIVVSLYDDVEELARLINLIHAMRNKHLHTQIKRRDKKYEYEVFPLGRTHFALSSHLKKELLAYYADKGIHHKMMRDKVDASRENYFFPSLSPDIDIYSGTATLLEFNSVEDMAQKSDKLRKYIIQMTQVKFKLKTVQTSISDSQRIHNIKGKFESESRAVEDIAVFSYLGLKLHGSSQMMFPKSLYQSIRTQLIEFKKRYKHLSELTIDWCEGKVRIIGNSPSRMIYHGSTQIAIERKPKKKIKIDLSEDSNPYLKSKRGE